MTSRLPLVIVGAGAAGLMAAIAAASAEAVPILVLERTRDGGRKILISGGGRCNVLPSRLNPPDFVTDSSPHTLKKLLLRWPLDEQREFFEAELGIPLAYEADTGKLFPRSNRARDVRDGLVARARTLGAQFRFEASVEALIPPETPEAGWTLALAGGERIRAEAVILAAGGQSVPATGSDGTVFRILRRLGHTVNELYPALTPLTSDPPQHRDLAGVSLEVTLIGQGPEGRRVEKGGFLFTHRGYSGPTVLNLSHLTARGTRTDSRPELRVQWTHEPAEEWDARLRAEDSGSVRALLRRSLPDRLADRLLEEAEVDLDASFARLTKEERRRLATRLGAYPLPWTGNEGYRKAEVTGGGVALGEVDPKTLESRIHPGLFLCGELLDAFGPIGGYNFAWAWSTGRTAGLGAAAPSDPLS